MSDDPGLAGTITGVDVVAGDAATQALPVGRLPTAVADAVNHQLLAGEQILRARSVAEKICSAATMYRQAGRYAGRAFWCLRGDDVRRDETRTRPRQTR
jgi:hypothetical protein